MKWIVCQIGAREHYAVARALSRAGRLEAVLTDFWAPPGRVPGWLPGAQRWRERFHPDLSGSAVRHGGRVMLAAEAYWRARRLSGWEIILRRNRLFQARMLRHLKDLRRRCGSEIVLFSYSYAAGELFRFAREAGWRTVLGQIDPGPEEERIVVEEHRRYPELVTGWAPAPRAYWIAWQEELALADRVVVNSPWAARCLGKEGVAGNTVVVPLVLDDFPQSAAKPAPDPSSPLRLLFLGQILLRKGIGRLLDAMRLMKNEAVQLDLVGPSGINPSVWQDLPAVRWHGPVSRGAAGDFYQNADYLILPTLSDGFALTQLEAVSRGLPVIASPFCGAVVQDGINGWMLPDCEPDTIRDVVLKAARQRIGHTALSPEFRLDNLAGSLESLL